MGEDNKKLTDIYNEAKRLRLVLNKGEFAKRLGYSSAHLHQLMSSDDNVAPDILSKAFALLATGTPIIKLSTTEERLNNERTERSIARDSIIKVMAQKIKELEAVVKRQPLTETALDFDRAVEREVKRSLDEWSELSS